MELLIVIAIIAVVSTVVFPNFLGIRQRARDTTRKSNLGEIQKALELYKLDQNPQVYPTGGLDNLCNQCWSSGANCSNNIYIRKFPCDPAGPQPTPYFFERDASDTLKYLLVACLENPVDESKDQTTHLSCSSTSYTVHEP